MPLPRMLPYENKKQDYVTLSPHVLGALGRVLTDTLIFLIGYLCFILNNKFIPEF